jgi:hypothetical protein
VNDKNNEQVHEVRISRYKGDLWFAYCRLRECDWRLEPTDLDTCKGKRIEHALRTTRQVYS